MHGSSRSFPIEHAEDYRLIHESNYPLLPLASHSFGSNTEDRHVPTDVGANTLFESSMGTGVLSPLLWSYLSLVSQFNWRDHYNVVTAEEACAFNRQSSLVVFPTDRPNATAVVQL